MKNSRSELDGHATTEGTARFASRVLGKGKIPKGHFRRVEGSGLTLTSLGMGTYLGEADEGTNHAVEEAALLSLRSGAINVLDTAINYRHQRAERSLGRALAQAVGAKLVARDEVFLSTKNGYLAPDSESGLSPRAYVQQELIGTRALAPTDIVGGSHAMSVPFLRDQLARSLNNLGVATVDLLYLHNPGEAQLEEVGRKAFFERLRSAFEFYEEARRKGRLVSYGLATWDSFRMGRTDPGYLSLEEVAGLAQEVGGTEHGFRFVQFPLNLMMTEAYQLRNQLVRGERSTLLQAAHALGIATFSSVPLLQGQLTHGGVVLPGLSPAQSALQFARSAPYHLAPLVGQKDRAHLEENLRVAEFPPLGEKDFSRMIDDEASGGPGPRQARGTS